MSTIIEGYGRTDELTFGSNVAQRRMARAEAQSEKWEPLLIMAYLLTMVATTITGLTGHFPWLMVPFAALLAMLVLRPSVSLNDD